MQMEGEFLSGSTPDFQAPLFYSEAINAVVLLHSPPLPLHGFNSHTVLELSTTFGGAEGAAGALRREEKVRQGEKCQKLAIFTTMSIVSQPHDGLRPPDLF